MRAVRDSVGIVGFRRASEHDSASEGAVWIGVWKSTLKWKSRGKGKY